MKLILILKLLFLSTIVIAQNDYYSNCVLLERNCKVVFGEDGGFAIDIVVNGIAGEAASGAIVYSELETIVDARCLFSNGKKVKQSKMLDNDLLTKTFYSGTRALEWDIEPGSFALTYRLEHPNAFYFSSLDFGQADPVMLTRYNIQARVGYVIDYDTNSVLTEDSLFKYNRTGDRSFEFTFERSLEKDIEEDELFYLRVIQMPKEAKDGFMVFTDWYRSFAAPNCTIPEKTADVFMNGKQVEDFPDSMAFVEHLFEKVRREINYIDIENNVGGLQPRSPEQTLASKRGDCKDMANLLTQVLRLHGFSAYLGIVPTTSHNFKNDFPSIASANHAICMVQCENYLIPLDATDPLSPFGWPSLHTQGSDVLIVREYDYLLSRIVPKEPRESQIKVVLEVTDDWQEAKVSMEFSGYSQWMFERISSYLSKEDAKVASANYLADLFPGLKLSDIDINSNASITSVRANARLLGSKRREIKDALYWTPDFVPIPYGKNELLKEEIVEFPFAFDMLMKAPVPNQFTVRFEDKECSPSLSNEIEEDMLLYKLAFEINYPPEISTNNCLSNLISNSNATVKFQAK